MADGAAFISPSKITKHVRRLRTIAVIVEEEYARRAAPAIRLQQCCKLNGIKRPIRSGVICNNLVPILSQARHWWRGQTVDDDPSPRLQAVVERVPK